MVNRNTSWVWSEAVRRLATRTPCCIFSAPSIARVAVCKLLPFPARFFFNSLDSKNSVFNGVEEPRRLMLWWRHLADRPKDRRHRGQILAVWSKIDLQPLKQNLCLAFDSKKVKTKSSLNSLGITDMVLDNQWASNWWNAKIKLFWCVLNSEVRENKAPPNFGFVFVLQLFKVFRLGGFSWV